jgi:phosphoglycerate dehydrogenase-like enzyme
MRQFTVGLSSDFVKPDGAAAFPSFDLVPLLDDPRVALRPVPVIGGRIRAQEMEGLDALILLAAKFDAQSFPLDGRLALIARFGVGYDSVDVQACTRNHTALVITPNGVRRPVAVAILTFILALSGKLMQKDRIARQGPAGWARRTAHMGRGLVGQTLGSIGIGNIGAEMFRLAKPLGMNFVAHDPVADVRVIKELGIEPVALDALFRRSDYLAVNCPLTPDTAGLVNAQRLSLMKPSACLINTARGPIVDTRALHVALQSGRLGGAALDVFEEEPLPAEEPLLKLDNVIVTPHALCWTDQCFAGIGADDVAAVKAVMAGVVPAGIVNSEIARDALWLSKLQSHAPS